jgi:drug/metabolite transporter (DMT)-like permease/co-chaperonin GroES (HSP10)
MAGGATVLLWASAFIGLRSAAPHLGGGPLALGRLAVATLILGLLVLRRRSCLRVARRDGFALLVCGVLWFGAYNVALGEAERRVDAGTAAMLVNVGPVLIALLAGVVLREGFAPRLVQGLAVAFVGAIVIGLATRSRGSSETTGALLCLLSALLYAAGVVAQKPVLARVGALEVTFLACAIGFVVCLPFAPRLVHEMGHVPAGALAWTVYLGAGPTAVAFTTWAYALSRTTAGRMGALTYLVPPLAVLMGWLLLGEAPPAAALGGGLLCLAGVAITRTGTPTARVPTTSCRPQSTSYSLTRWHSGASSAKFNSDLYPSEVASMKLKPLGDRLIVRAIEEEETTASGIVLPDTAKEKPQKGKVLAVGDGKVNEDTGKRTPLDVSEGDEVLYSKYGGTEIKVDGEELLVLRESDVLAKVQ